MRYCFTLGILCCFLSVARAQTDAFPATWTGNWKGELQWFKTGKTAPLPMNMELRIQPGDSAGTYSWLIKYGTDEQDNRPYLLKPKDPAKGHWVIDEKNGIVLDQFWLGGKLCGAFTVLQSTILNTYWMEDGKLHVEFFSMGAKPTATTGKGTNESPKVDSYWVGGYQKAVLTKVN